MTSLPVMTTYILGLEWYIWVFLVLIIIIIGLIGVLMLIRIMAGPAWGYVSAKLQKLQTVGFNILDTGSLEMIPLNYKAGVVSDTTKGSAMSWLLRDAKPLRFGSLDAVLIRDRLGIAQNPDVLEAIKTLHEKYGFSSWDELRELISDGKISEEEIPIPVIFNVPLYEVERYIAPVKAGDFSNHVSTLVQEEVESKIHDGMPLYLKVFIAVEISVFLFALVLGKFAGVY